MMHTFKKLRESYEKAKLWNGYLMSLGGGRNQFPSFEEWVRENVY